MGRSPCCDKMGLKKGPWMPEEDTKLRSYIQQHGHGNWHALPSKAGLRRCGKSCRLRWANYLRPEIKRGKFSIQEDDTIIQLHALLGNRWSAIATHLPRRTDNEIKNYWNTHLKKRLTKMGIDPVTHKPTNQESTAHISHMAQWETARLEAEARSKLEFSITINNQDKQWACTNHAGYPSTFFNEYPSVHHSAQIYCPANNYSLGSQSFIKDDTPSVGLSYTRDSIKVVGGCWEVLENDDTVKNYWDNTLNAITRPVEARLYPRGDQVQS